MKSTLRILHPLPAALGLIWALAISGCAILTPGEKAPVAVAPPAQVATANGATPVQPTVTAPLGSPVPGSGASAPAATPSSAAGRPDPAAPKPFDEVIKGATRQAGFIPLWRKDEKLWLEIAPDQLDQPFLLSVNISHSVGERGLYGSQMGPSWLAAFRKTGSQQLQLIALNTSYSATGAPMKTALAEAFSASLLGSAAIASEPHDERKSVLIDAAFLVSDIPGYSTRLEAAYRLPFGLDRANSFFEKARATDELTTVNARIHFVTARLPALPVVPSPAPVAAPPTTTPDARSLFVGYVYNFTKLPEQAMAPRKTDPRLGHFFDVVTDLSNDLKVNPRQHYINRWRLEKKDPDAALSEPLHPIVFWLDKNIPLPYRASVQAGVLEWNKAFEKIGFKNAVVAEQQADDADWDSMDSRHASIRWFLGADASFARGPVHTDPRTGEIIDADIAMSDVFGRGARRFIVEDVGTMAGGAHAASRSASMSTPWSAPPSSWHKHGDDACTYAHDKTADLDFTLDMLEARGELAPDGPEAEAFVRAVIKDTIMHEVGHTLGLKHNFKASTVVTRAQLQDKAFTEQNGIAGSVMDYSGFNLASSTERQGSYTMNTLGAYDYWAIEYAYRPLEAAQEAAELARIAARSTEPGLAYADDADAGGSRSNDGIDPLVNRFDLGDDPLAFYQKRFQLSRELWTRIENRPPQPGDDATRQRRLLLNGFRQLTRAADLVGKYVGGMYTQRDLPGTTGRAAYTPVEPAKQREALQFLTQGLFNAESFRFKPQFLASLSPDYNEWDRGGPVSVPAAVLQVQAAALDRLMSAGTAARLLDLPSYVVDKSARNVISLAEVYGNLQGAVWSELQSGKDIDPLRRNLQREHLKRVQALLTRGSPTLPPDALSLVRMNATALRADLKRGASRRSLSIESRAHLSDSLALLTEALRASMVRS